MIPTLAQLSKIVGRKVDTANATAIVEGLKVYGDKAGLTKPHRMAHYLAQMIHESGGFRYDKEIWGPTAAQKRYDTRTDLGNTAAADGDGKLYMGRGPIQITGKANYEQFRDWCRKQRLDAPDFVAHPEAVNTDPWEGLGPIWYWTTRKLNVYADENNIEQLTKRINGGLNGFSDRIHFYIRASLVLLGYDPDDIEGFQRQAQKDGLLPKGKDQIDGDAGPKTRTAMHQALAAMSQTAVKAAPVTAPVDVEAPAKGLGDVATGAGVATGGLGLTVNQLQEQLTPFSAAGNWIGTLVVVLAIVAAVLTVGGLAWRAYAVWKKRKALDALNAGGDA